MKGAAMKETPALLDAGPAASHLVGVLCEPATGGERGVLGALLLNAGLVPRPGPARLYVDLARRLAAAGVPSLRLDYAGVGDSPPRDDAVPFERASVEETRAAMDHLAAAAGCRDFLLIGVCSGALAAFQTAVEDERARSLVLVNPPGLQDSIPEAIAAEVDRTFAADYYTGVAAHRWRSWFKLLTGRANYRAIAAAVRRKLSGPASIPPPPAAAEVRGRIQALAERGVRALHVYSRGDWGLGYLRWVLGAHEEALVASGMLRVEVLEGADHLVTPVGPRAFLEELVEEWACTARG